MPVLLCYGDSNTYGAGPMQPDSTSRRYGPESRWPRRLARLLGPDWDVIEEGLPGRTTCLDSPFGGAHKNGLSILPAILESHAPIDTVALMLGTNDLKACYAMPARDITRGVETLIQKITMSGAGPGGASPEILLICPVPVDEVAPFGESIAGGAEKSRRLGPLYRELADRYGARFLDAGAHAAVSPEDGIHLSETAHLALADAIAPLVRATASAAEDTVDE